ncbi:integrin beta-3-like isoform X2 [Narcine bancroftii]|uniref:integrin beta-3-like isoform X2 n=1 Tax=Narcine bancroftii TaxID=1343680 RepID=UPI0038322C79
MWICVYRVGSTRCGRVSTGYVPPDLQALPVAASAWAGLSRASTCEASAEVLTVGKIAAGRLVPSVCSVGPQSRSMGVRSLWPSLFALAALLCASAVHGNNKCKGALTCVQCLEIDPICAWCLQEDFGGSSASRCDLLENLIRKGCRENATEFPQGSFQVLQGLPLSEKGLKVDLDKIVQFSPQKIAISLRRGESRSFTVQARQVEDYPVDIYYLMDLSFSMKDDLENIQQLGTKVAMEMAKKTSNLQLGFGAFVDKPVSPYIYMATEDEIKNPCVHMNTVCIPVFGFKNVLKLTEEVNRFNEEVIKQKVSRNRDTPEGGMDAVLQVSVCKEEIGWRQEATHMLVLVTDATSHLALDGRLAGIINPNDGHCHIGQNNEYNASAVLDYPSLALVTEKLTENNINLIFAVTAELTEIYKNYSRMIPGTTVGTVYKDSSNVLELIIDAYEKIRSQVELEILNLPKELSVSFDAICGNDEVILGQKFCTGLQIGDTVNFTVKLEARECPKDEKVKTFMLKPILFKDALEITVNFSCSCECESNAVENSTLCTNGNGTFECGVCKCLPGRFGPYCECEEGDGSTVLQETCSPKKGDPICNNRGECICGQCVCHRSNYGIISGQFCECDDFSCGHYMGKLCSGNGQCQCGECRCFPDWTDNYCNCSTKTEPCRPPVGPMCHGRGECKCGKCVCKGGAYGDQCEKCPTCLDACTFKRPCVECKVFDTGELKEEGKCEQVCRDEIRLVEMLDMEAKSGAKCRYKDENGCIVHFGYHEETSGKSILLVIQEPECPPPLNLLYIILPVMGAILLLALVALLIWKLLVTIHDRKEFAKFEAERVKAKWDTMNNPLYKGPTSTFTNLTYSGKVE